MKLETLISALRKCEREMGWYEGAYESEMFGLFHPGDHRPVKCQRQADKFAAAIIGKFNDRHLTATGEYLEVLQCVEAVDLIKQAILDGKVTDIAFVGNQPVFKKFNKAKGPAPYFETVAYRLRPDWQRYKKDGRWLVCGVGRGGMQRDRWTFSRERTPYLLEAAFGMVGFGGIQFEETRDGDNWQMYMLLDNNALGGPPCKPCKPIAVRFWVED